MPFLLSIHVTLLLLHFPTDVVLKKKKKISVTYGCPLDYIIHIVAIFKGCGTTHISKSYKISARAREKQLNLKHFWTTSCILYGKKCKYFFKIHRGVCSNSCNWEVCFFVVVSGFSAMLCLTTLIFSTDLSVRDLPECPAVPN